MAQNRMMASAPAAPSVVIAAGGTGGHIYPGIAIAEALRDLEPNVRITFVGTARGLEGELIPQAGHELELYEMAQFNGQGWRKVVMPPALARGVWRAHSVLRRRAAAVAVSTGGYAGVPLTLGARLARIPSLVVEPGSVPGLANRFAARFTPNIATAFPATRFPRRHVRHTGLPLRNEITGFDRNQLRAQARRAFGLRDGQVMVLATGGSQGALTINRLALELGDRWAARDDIRLVVKTGARTHDDIAAQLDGTPAARVVQLVQYFDRIDHAYAAADLAIVRGGANTLAELAVAGVATLVVPLPHHEHDEQTHNAVPFIDAGGALLVQDHDAVVDVVAPLLEPLLADPAALATMGQAMQAQSHPQAARTIAAWILELSDRSQRARRTRPS